VIALFFLLLQDSEIVRWPVPEFTLTDQDGRTVTRDMLLGRIWIADFIFTRCAGPCPIMTHQMKNFQDELPKEIELVSFSVDPARDTPAVLKDYAEQMKADTTRWRFLTGDKELIFTLAIQGFKSPTADPKQGSDQVIHSTYFYLVDAKGVIYRYYNYDVSDPQAAMERLRNDAIGLLKRRQTFMILPTVNAMLNGTSAILLLAGFFLIKSKRLRAHKACMLAALTVSALFLISYLVYHFEVGSVKYQGPIREVYLGILLSHTVLAVVIVPLIAMTVLRGFRDQFEKHRKIAKVTFPLWLYVSVTGVVIYLMLYA
jgi:protein SCO1/2/putative membrane protein